MPTTFNTPLNNVRVALGSPHVIGSGTLVLIAGQGAQFGTTFPLRATCCTAATVGTAAEVLTIFSVTARSADTLTVTAIEGTADRAYAVGDVVEMRATAGTVGDIQAAVNALEAQVVALPASAITTGTMAATRLGTGGNSFTFLNGGQAFQIVRPSTVAEGRLSTSSSDDEPASTTSAGTLYYIPAGGNMVTLFDGPGVVGLNVHRNLVIKDYNTLNPYLTVNISGITTSNYDVFLEIDPNPPYDRIKATLVGWSNDSTRFVTLVPADGMLWFDSSKSRRYVGTIRGVGSGVVADNYARRFVYNHYNQRARRLSYSYGGAASYTITNAVAWRQLNADATATRHLEFLIGYTGRGSLDVTNTMNLGMASGMSYYQGVMLDGSPGNYSPVIASQCGSATGATTLVNSVGFDRMAEGYHWLTAVELTLGTGTITVSPSQTHDLQTLHSC
jgi:hypothetical protein